MVKRSDHSTSSTDKEVVADQAAKLKAKDAPLGQLQDVLPGTEIGWVATEVEGAQLPDVGMQPAADTPQATAAVDSDLSVATDAEATQPHVEQLEEPVTEAAALSPSASSSGIEQVAGASAWLGYGGDEVGAQARAGAAQPSPVGNNFAVTPLPSAGSTPAVNVHVGVDGGTPLGPQTLSMLTASGDTTGQLREDGQQIASGQLSTAGASGAVSWQLGHSAGLYGQLQLSGDGHWRYTLDNASSRVQGLCAGEQVSEHFIAAVTDSAGRTQFIPLSIAIDGSADRAIISGTDVGQANEDKLLLVSGMLTVQDADAGQAQFKPAVLTGSFGLLTLDTVGHWVYELDNANPAVQALGAGKAATDVLTVTSVDGTTHQVTITVHGSNDQALIVGTHSGAVSEDSLLSVQGLLYVTDIDQGEASFVPQTLAGTFGQLQLETAGHWTYLLDNTNPAVQALGAGAAATDTLTVTTLDGTPQQITITIKGSNDTAQIAGTLTGAVTEESTLIAKGTLTVTDVDQGQARFNPEVFNGQYGSFSLDANGHWLYVLDNSNAAVQRLAAGEQVRDVMTVTSVDGTSCQLVVSVNGSNDAPVLAAQSQTVTEDGARLNGRMVATDVDTGDTHVFSTGTTVAGFMLNADGSYSFDPSNAAYQHLAAGQTQDVVIPVIVTDSAGATSTQNLTITVTGTNDAAVVGGQLTNTVTEDSVVSTAGMLRAGGQLTVVDPDGGEDHFVAQTGVTGAGHYGSFSIDASGHYSYTADNTQTAIQQLKAGETLTDRFTVRTADGTQQVVTITINGAEDRPVLQAQTHTVTEDGARLTGQMLATDVDAADTQRFSTPQPVAGFTLNSDGSFSFDPANAGYQHLATGQTQDLVIPVTVTDSAGATSTQNLTITVTGVNDAAVISGVSNGTITEDQGVNASYTLSCGGKLVVTDVDTGEATFAVQHGTGANGYGSFVLGPSGTWTYSADNTQTAIQQLKAGDTLTDTFTVSSTDGTTHTVTVTIQGSNDAPVLAAQTHAVTEDGALLQGRMVATDVDAHDTQAFSIAQAVDGFTLNADGSYSFDPSHASYQHLAAGQTQDVVIPVTVTDSTGLSSTQNLTITVTGANDVAVITSVDAGFVIEDRAVQGGHIKAFGKLGVTDADAGQDHFVAQTDTVGTNGLGHFTFTSDGQWTYSADNSQTAIQQLKSGDSLTDSLTVHSADGTAHTITVTLQGANDAPVLSVQSQAVTEDGTLLSGHMVATDVDAHDTQTFSIANAVDGFTLNADGSYSFDPSHTSYQHIAAGQSQDVVIPVTVIDSAGAASTQNLTITVTGTNDGAVITGADTGRVVEDQTLSVTGQLQVSDVDDGQAHFVAQTATAGSYGSLTLGEDGHWQYQLDNSKPEVQALKSTETATDSFTVHSADGISHSITVTIQGQRDSVVIGGVDVGVVKEDVSAVTGGHLVATGESAEFVPLQQHTTLGEFSMDAAGAWIYTLDNSRVGTQALKAGETATDTVSITHTDGTTHTITITVMGMNDAPVLSAQSQTVTEDGAQLTGHMVATDVDAADTQTFSTAQSVDGFTLNTDGSYSFDPAYASYQHLAAGQTQDVVIPVTVTDSARATSTQNLTITVTGVDDGAIIGGVNTGAVTEDQSVQSGQLHASGQLTVADVDTGEEHFVVQTGVAASYGSFSIDASGHWTYAADNSQAAVQQLKAGATLSDSFTVSSADGSTHTVTVTLTGSNDAPVLQAQTQSVAEDGTRLRGLVVASDVDAGDSLTFSIGTAVAGFTLNADGSYSFDPSDAAYQQLAAGQVQTLSIPITVTDTAGASSTQNLLISITGTGDAAVIGGRLANNVTEDAVVSTGGLLRAAGQLTVADPDAGEDHFVAQTGVTGAGHYGSFSIDASGHYSYTADNTQTAIQQLKAGETLNDSFTVATADGTQQVVTITIKGSEDRPVLQAQTQAVTEDGLRLDGKMLATDADAGDTQAFSVATPVDGFTLHADGSYSFDPGHASYQYLAAGQTQYLIIPITVTDSAGASSTQNLTITITGVDDGAVITGVDSGAVTEDQSVQNGHLQTSGQLTITDTDRGEDHFVAQTDVAGSSGLGRFSLSESGHWTYSADNTQSAVQQLQTGQSLTDTLTVQSADGTAHTVTVTIHGANDAPVLAAQTQAITEDGALLQGQMVATDVDAHDTQTFSIAQAVDGFTLNADGSYSFDPSHTAYQHLAAGQAQDVLIPVTVADGNGASHTATLTITITGANDGATVTGARTADVIEDTNLLGGSSADADKMVARGKLNVADVDSGEAAFVPQDQAGSAGLGMFHLGADGQWRYVADPKQPAIQALKNGQTLDETALFHTADGTPVTLTVTIHGTEDRAVIGGVDSATVAEDQSPQAGHLQASGSLSIVDPDRGDAIFMPLADIPANQGLGLGLFSIDVNGHWSYSVDNSLPAIQKLKAGQSLTETLTVTSGDGSTHSLTVTIQGSNDAPVLQAQAQAVTEDSTLLQGRMVATDVDAGDTQAFSIAQPVDGFTLNADGTYSFDPANAAYQHLAAGQTQDVVISVTVTDSAGTTSTQNLTITITGSNDGAVIGGRLANFVTEDSVVSTGGMLRAGGQLTVVDPDAGEAVFVAQTGVTGAGHYGSFSIDASGRYSYTADNTQTAIQQLKAGQTLSDSFTVATADGTQQVVTITINGAEDKPVLQAQTHAVTEDGAQLTGQMLATDADAGDTLRFSISQAVAGFAIKPDGSFSFDPANAAYQHLAAGQTQDVIIPVTVSDSAGGTHTQNLTITVSGVNDGAVISGVSSGTITEDQSVSATHILSCGGKLDVVDADTGEAGFAVQHGSGANGYGSFVLGPSGTWTYSADNTQASIQQLKAGDTLTDTFTVSSKDGTTHTVTVTIQGSNDAPVLTAQTQAVHEDGTLLQGRMVASDVDAGDTQAFSIAQPVDGFTLNADGSYSFDPANAAYQHLAAGQTQGVVIPVTVTDSAGATSTQNLTITITGSNDGAVIGGRIANYVTEDAVVSTGGMLRAGGQLTVVDPDAGEDHFVVLTGVTGAGHYGSFSIDASGHYSYTADNTQTVIQQLKAGETLADRFTVTTADGTQQVVTITINGAEDRPVLQAQTHAVTEDGARLTGQMLATDADAGDTQRFSVAHPVAGFVLNPDGSFSFNPAHASYQHLAAGQTQDVVIPVTVIDSAGGTSTQNLTITVAGSNDGARIAGVDAGSVTEDTALQSGRLQASGQLTVTDIDTGEAHFAAQTDVAGSQGLGHFCIDAAGHWTYTADNRQMAIQQLKNGDSLSDTLRVTSADGTQHTITVSIHGVNDAPDISSTRASARLVLEDAQTSSIKGVLHARDMDAGDTLTWSVTGNGQGTYGHLDFDPQSGQWVYKLDNADADTNALRAGQQGQEVFQITATDSSGATDTSVVRVMVVGADDRAAIAGVDTGTVSEDGVLQAAGQLSISDADAGEAAFQASPRAPGQHGVFSLAADGSWTYALNNSDTDVQALTKGQSLSDSLVVKSVDGSTHTITLSIQGRDDGAVITGVDTGRVTEDQNVNAGQLQASGQLTLIDADTGQHQFTAQSQVAGHYGTFSIDASGAWTYTADNSQDAVQQLGRNDSLSERFRVTSADGTQHMVVVTLQGSNDVPVIQAQTRSVTEDGAMLTGQMRASDTDIHDRLQFSTTSQIAGFNLAADGSYSFDPKASAYQNLGAGVAETLSIPVTVSDQFGAHHTRDLLITVTGTNDGAIIQGKDHGDVVEDLNPANGLLRAQGHLGVTDADASQSAFVVQTGVVGHFGRFSIDAAGAWTYEIDNSSDRVQALREGAQAVEHFVVRSLDGTSHAVRVTVHGSNDAPVVTSTAQSAIEDGAPLSGQLRVTDRDRGDQAHFQLDHPVAGFTLDSDGTYRFDPSDPAHQDLRQGQMMRLDIPVTVTDDAGAVVHQTITITLTGRNDAAVISGLDQAAVTEDSRLQNGLLQASGQLQVSDIDDGEANFTVQTAVAGSPGLGHFSINASGQWLYTADNTQAAIQALKAGESLTDTVSVSSADGTTHTLTVTIRGTNDAPVLAGQTQAVTEDGTQLTGQMVATDVDSGDTLAFTLANAVDGFTLNADGSYQFDPGHASYQHLAAGQTQDVVIPITVTDSAGATSTQNLTITLTGSNDGPLVTHGTAATAADLGTILEDTPRLFTEAELLRAVGASDADDGTSLHIVAGSLTSAHGTFTGDAAHGFTFTPAANFSGQDVDLQFSVTDGTVSREAHAQLDITPVADAPVRDGGISITTDFNNVDVGAGGWKLSDPTPLGWQTSEASGVEIGQERLYGGSGNNQILSLTASWSSNIYRDLATQAGQTVHVGFDLSARPGFAMTPVEVLWEGKVIDTISPTAGTYAMQHHAYDLVAAGGNSRLEFRATGQGEARALFDNIQIGTPDHLTLGDQDILLKPYLGYQLADTDGSETLSYAIHGLPVGFTLTDGTHSFTVASAGQVIETTGWNQEALALRAPHGFQGDVSIQVTARAEEGSNHQTASAADITLHLSGLPVSHAAVIGGDTSVTVTEDQQVNTQGNLEHFGQLTINDPDAGEAQFVPQNAVQAQYGHYTIDQNGFWLYEADNKLAAIQQLKTGEHLTDSFTVHSADGTAQTITVTIQGQDDAPAFVPHAGPTRSDDVYTQIAQVLGAQTHQNFKYLSSMMLNGADTYPFERALVIIKNAGVSLIAPDGSVAKAFGPHGGTLTEVPISEMIAWHAKGAGYQVVFTDAKASEVGVYAYNNGNPGMLSGRYPYTDFVLHPEQQIATLYPVMHDAAAASGGAAVQGSAFMPPAIAPLLFDGGQALEDSGLLVTGFIEVKDADAQQSAMQPQTGTATHYGRFSIDVNGDWIYQLDNIRPEVQQLGDGQTLVDTITVHSEDGTAHEVNVTIHGQNDGAVIAGADSGTVVEDHHVTAAGNIVAKGLLTVSDVDAGEAAFVAQNDVATQYGHFSLAADGHWTYTVDNSSAAVQGLQPGGTPGETADVSQVLAQALAQSNEAGFKAVAEALTQQQPGAAAGVLDLSIQGAAIVLSGPAGTTPVVYAMDANGRANIGVDELLSWLHQGQGYELHLQGNQSDVQVFVHDRGDGSELHPLPLSASADLSDPASAAQHLALSWHTPPVPAELSETVTVRSVDGTEHTINLSIFGTAENAVIAGVDSGSVTEDAHVTGAGMIEAHGKLTVQDANSGQAAFTSLFQVAGQYGHLSLQPDGQWIYAADNNSAALNALNKGQTALETFVVKSVDGTAHSLTITVNGADEKADLWPEIARNLLAQSGGDTRGYHVIAERMAAGDSNGLRDVVMNVFDGKPTVVDAAGHVLHTFDRYSKFFGYYVPMNELSDQLKAHPGAMLVLQGSVGGNANYYFHDASNEMLLNFNGAYSYQPDKRPIGGLPINGIPHPSAVAATQGNAAAQLGGADSGSVLADGDALLQTQGHLTVLDADGGQAHFAAQQDVQGQYGKFSIDAQGSWHYQADGHAPALSQLAAGQHLSETFTVHSADGTSHTITVQLFGDNASAAVITGVDTAALSEDQAVQGGQLQASGQLSITDGDAGQDHFNAQSDVAGSAGLGHFSLDASGAWTYTVDNSKPQIQQLKAGETVTDTLTVSSADGTTHQITVTLSGSNDAAVITGADSGSVSEDGGLSASGKLVISDVDSGQAIFTAQNQAAAHGSFTLTASGDWTYTLDNHSAAVQALKTGETLSDSITVRSADGSSHVVTVLINGANDAPVLQAQSQTVAEDGSVLRGQMQASDADHGEHLQFSTSAQVAGFTLHADGSYSFDPGHADYQSLAAGQQRDFSIPVVVTDASGAHAAQMLTLHITGSNDGAMISGVDTGHVQVGGQAQVDGQLQVSDADAGQAGFQAGQVAGSFGSLSIDAQGHWQYQLNSSDSFVQQLLPHSSLTDQLSVQSVDGTTHSIDVQISGPVAVYQPPVQQPPVNAVGADSYHDILTAVRAGGYQYQALADALDRGDRGPFANVELAISGSHVQIVDAAGHLVQSYSPVSADYAATVPMADLMLWHAQGHKIIVSNDSGMSSTHVWLHDAGDMHNLHVDVGGTGFNGWVGEYSLGELSLNAPPPAPAPPAADDFGQQHDDPAPSVDDLQGGTHAAVVVDLHHLVSPADNTHHEAAAPAPAQGDALHDAVLDVHSSGSTGGAADSYSPVADYLQFADSTMPAAAVGEHSSTSNPAVHDYLAAAGIGSLTPTADDMHMPPTAVLMDLQHAGVSGEHTAANEQSVDPVADDLAAIENPLADDPNQHHGGV